MWEFLKATELTSHTPMLNLTVAFRNKHTEVRNLNPDRFHLKEKIIPEYFSCGQTISDGLYLFGRQSV